MHEYFVVNEYQWNLNDLWSPVAHPARWSARDPNPQMLSIVRTDSGMRWYVSQILFCQGFRISTGQGYFHFPSFSGKQPCNVLTLIACASCAQLLRTEMNYIVVTVETVFWRARSGLGALSWPHLPLSIHLGSRQSPADSTLQRRCRPEIISASSLKLPAWTRDHTPPSHDFDGLGRSSVLVEQEFGNFKHWFLNSVLAMVNLVILSSSYIASSIVANELRERSCNLG